MTNIRALPQLPQWTFQMVKNGDFRDGVQFVADASAAPPTPIIITGISFRAELRPAEGSSEPALSCSTSDATMLVDGPNGALYFNLAKTALKDLPTQTMVGDIIAEADGLVINLCKDNGPLSFDIREGVSR